MNRIGALVASFAILLAAGSLFARDIPEPGLPVSVVATVAPQKNGAAPALTVNDVLVSQNKQHREVTGGARCCITHLLEL